MWAVPAAGLRPGAGASLAHWEEGVYVPWSPTAVGGSMYQPAPAARSEKTPASVRRLAPGHGEHTEEVLLEIGVPRDRIVSLRNEGVLGP